jgi:hypothetical protein
MHVKNKIRWIWWCKSIMPATQEAEIGRITFKARPDKKLARLHLNQQARYYDFHL